MNIFKFGKGYLPQKYYFNWEKPIVNFEQFVYFASLFPNLEVGGEIVLNKKGELEIFVPPQKVSYASITYERDSEYYRQKGNRLFIGDIHSHHSMGAFQSGVDFTSEKKVDGFYITLSYEGKKFKTHQRLIWIGTNVPIIESVIPFEGEIKKKNFPPDWVENIHYVNYNNYYYDYYNSNTNNMKEHKNKNGGTNEFHLGYF